MKRIGETVMILWLIIALAHSIIGQIDRAIFAMTWALFLKINIKNS